MRKAEKGLHTRTELAAALKELLKEKPLSKIRVHDLTDYCGLYRQTFYYHFEDVYALLDWSFQQDVRSLPLRQAQYATRAEALLAFLDEVDDHRGYYAELLNTRTVQKHRVLLCETILYLTTREPCHTTRS